MRIRLAAILLWITGFGYGLPCLPAIHNAVDGQPIPYIMGLPAYGDGPLESRGVHSTVPLLSAFLAVCILHAVAGLVLWRGRRAGAVLALATIPLGAFFWWGFELPFAPVFALGWAVLIFVGRSSLGRQASGA